MVSIIPGHGIAPAATFSRAVKPVIRPSKVPASVELAYIAGDGSHLPDMGRSDSEGSLCQCGIFVAYQAAPVNILQFRERADLEYAYFFPDVIQSGDFL